MATKLPQNKLHVKDMEHLTNEIQNTPISPVITIETKIGRVAEGLGTVVNALDTNSTMITGLEKVIAQIELNRNVDRCTSDAKFIEVFDNLNTNGKNINSTYEIIKLQTENIITIDRTVKSIVDTLESQNKTIELLTKESAIMYKKHHALNGYFIKYVTVSLVLFLGLILEKL